MKQVFLDSLGSGAAKFVLFICVGAQFYCGMSSITSASRMMYAFSRDRAVPGHQLWRRLNRERVPYMAAIAIAVLAFLCAFPAYFGTNGVVALRRGHVDRDDRALHRLRDPDLPPAARWATRGSRASGTSASTTSGSGRSPCLWVAFICDPLHPADLARAASRGGASSPGCSFNYAPIAVGGTLLLVGGWWLLSAQQVVQGPDRAGHAGGARAARGAATSAAPPARRPPRRRIGVEIPDRREPARAGSLH